MKVRVTFTNEEAHATLLALRAELGQPRVYDPDSEPRYRVLATKAERKLRDAYDDAGGRRA